MQVASGVTVGQDAFWGVRVETTATGAVRSEGPCWRLHLPRGSKKKRNIFDVSGGDTQDICRRLQAVRGNLLDTANIRDEEPPTH